MNRRVAELDGLRALAILPVLLHHCYPQDNWLRFIGEPGWAGVDLFFVLSGYLITGILLDTEGSKHYYRGFIARRALRIFPLYYLCLLVFSVATRIMNPSAWSNLHSWGGVGWLAIYLGNIRTAVVGQLPPFVFGPLWSLQVEEQFYFLYPVLVATLAMRTLRRVLWGCVIAAPMLRCLLTFMGSAGVEACYVLMPCRMDSLALGGLVAISMRTPSGSFGPRLTRSVAVAGLVAMLAMFAVALRAADSNTQSLPFMRSVGYTIIDLSCAAVLAYLVHFPGTALSVALRWRPLVYTGQISYGLYLLHLPASWVARRFFGVQGHSMASVPITFIAAFLAASLSWKFLERPILLLKERIGSTNSPDLAQPKKFGVESRAGR